MSTRDDELTDARQLELLADAIVRDNRQTDEEWAAQFNAQRAHAAEAAG